MKQDAASHLRDAAGAHMGFMVKCENGRSSHSPSGKRPVTAFETEATQRRKKRRAECPSASLRRKRDNTEGKNNYPAL